MILLYRWSASYAQCPASVWMIKKGIRKEIPANSGRSRLNLSEAVDVISHKVIIQADQLELPKQLKKAGVVCNGCFHCLRLHYSESYLSG
jgi:hypothetical protein